MTETVILGYRDPFLRFEFGNLVILYCFGFRISDFEFWIFKEFVSLAFRFGYDRHRNLSIRSSRKEKHHAFPT